MNFLSILAQTSRTAGNADYTQVDYGTRYVLESLDKIWQQATALSWEQAVVAAAFGIIPLMYGWRIYKVITVIGFGLLGLYIGMWLGSQVDKLLIGAILGAILFTILAIPLMRWAVCILGAVSGAVIAAGIWHAFSMPEQYVWTGALVGLVAGGMLSFVVFKLSVMLFTSFAGTALIILGSFALIYRYETFVQDPPTTHLNDLYYFNPWFLPLLLIIGTFFGIILQLRFLKSSKDWEI
jgi:MFS family permease